MKNDEMYSLKGFMSTPSCNVNRLSTKILQDYYEYRIANNSFSYVLNNGKTIHLTMNKSNFYHLTGLHKCEVFPDGIGGMQAWKKLRKNPVDLKNVNFTKNNIILKRVSMFNQLGNLLYAPSKITNFEFKNTNSDILERMHDVDKMIMLKKNGRIISLPLIQNPDNSYSPMSYLVDQEHYAPFYQDTDIKTPKTCMCERNDINTYIRRMYDSKSFGYMKYLSTDSKLLLKKYSTMLDRMISHSDIKTSIKKFNAHIKKGHKLSTRQKTIYGELNQLNSDISQAQFKSLKIQASNNTPINPIPQQGL